MDYDGDGTHTSGPISEPPVGSITEEKPAYGGDKQNQPATSSSSGGAGTLPAEKTGESGGAGTQPAVPQQEDTEKPPSTWRAGAPVPPGGVPIGGTQGVAVPSSQLDSTDKEDTSGERAFDDPVTRKVNLGWDCEREIDRLVREKLEGQNTDRTQLNRGVRQMAQYQQSWTGRIEDVCSGLGQTFLEGLYDGSLSLFRTVRQLEPTCKKVAKSVPIVIYEDEDDNADGFNDLIANTSEEKPPAAKPAKQKKTKSGAAEPSEEKTQQENTQQDTPKPKEKTRRKKADNESSLSSSTAMTSSAAKTLGGANSGSGGSKKTGDKKPDDAKAGDKEAASSSGASKSKDGAKPKKSAKEGGSGKSSSSKKGDESDRKSSATAASGSGSKGEGSGKAKSSSGTKKSKGDSKTVVTGADSTSAAAAALGAASSGSKKKSSKGENAAAA